MLMDGGTVWNVNPTSAIQQCLEIVENEEDIILDILLCDDYSLSEQTDLGKDSIYEGLRGKMIHNYYSNTNEIAETMRAYPNVNYRNLFVEKNPIIACLDFRNETTWPYQL